MRKITLTLAAAALVLGSLAVANAQTQGASKLNAQAQNATPDREVCGMPRLGPMPSRPFLGLRPARLLLPLVLMNTSKRE